MSTSAGPAAPFVRTQAGALRRLLVQIPSDAIGRVPPIHGEGNAIAERAREQFAILTGRLGSLGVAVVRMEPAAASIGSICADGAVLFEDGAFLMRPSDAVRRGEMPALEAALERANVPVIGRIAAPGLLDGGDVLVAGDTVFIGYPKVRRDESGLRRSVHGNALGREQLAAFVRAKGLRVVEVALASEVARLTSVASLLDEQTVLHAPGLLDASAFAAFQRIEVPRGEDYAAGVLVLGPRRVLANLRFRLTLPLLRKAKVAVEAIDLWEFGRAGLMPSSLGLPLKRG